MRPRLVVKHVVDNRVLSAEEPKDTSVRGAKVWARLRARETFFTVFTRWISDRLGGCRPNKTAADYTHVLYFQTHALPSINKWISRHRPHATSTTCHIDHTPHRPHATSTTRHIDDTIDPIYLIIDLVPSERVCAPSVLTRRGARGQGEVVRLLVLGLRDLARLGHLLVVRRLLLLERLAR